MSKRRVLELALLVSAVLLFVGCSQTTQNLPGIYSDPKSGRLQDFGPKGMFALKEVRHVVVGHWGQPTDDALKYTYLSFPQRGEQTEHKFSWLDNGFRLDTEGSEHYDQFTREPVDEVDDRTLVGLWRHENDGFLEFTEFTPWGTVIWFRKAKYEGDEYVGGGWAQYRVKDLSEVTISGMEYTLDVMADNQFNFTVSGSLLTLRSKKLKWKKEYVKVEAGDLREALAKAEPISKPLPTASPANSPTP